MENLREEINALERERSSLEEYRLTLYRQKFYDLYMKILNAFIVAHPERDGQSEFHHVRKVIEKMDRYPNLSNRDKPGEWLTIKGELHEALKDLAHRLR